MKAKDLFEDVPGDEGPGPGEGQRELTIAQIMQVLPRPARRRIIAILKRHYPDYAGPVSRLLRAELRPLERELATVGLIPDYAAYAIPYFVYTNAPSVQDLDHLDDLPDPREN